jgi:hypothetical protein
MKKSLGMLALVLLVALALPASALASDENQGQVVFGGNFVLNSGEVLDGDLLVLGGNVTLAEGSRVEGSVFLMGGNAVAAGVVEGDMALFGGTLSLLADARIDGDVTVFGGSLDRDPEAAIGGQVLSGDSVRMPFDFEFGRVLRLPIGPWNIQSVPFLQTLWFSGVSFILRAVLLAVLAVLVVTFVPVQAARVGRTIPEQPLITIGLGALTAIVVPVLLIVLAITICLIPITVVGFMALVVAIVFGWIGLGLEIGDRLCQSFKWKVHPAAAAGLGTLLLTIVADGIGFIPCVGWLAPALAGAFGLGSVIVTRFGTQIYAPASGAAQPLPPAGGAPAA